MRNVSKVGMALGCLSGMGRKEYVALLVRRSPSI